MSEKAYVSSNVIFANNHDPPPSTLKPADEKMSQLRENPFLLRSTSSPAHSASEMAPEHASRLKSLHISDETASNATSEDEHSIQLGKFRKKTLVEDSREFRNWNQREQYIRRQYKSEHAPEVKPPEITNVETSNSSGRRMSGMYTGLRLKSRPEDPAFKKVKYFISQFWSKSKAAVTSLLPSKPKKKKKLKDTKTRRDTPYPLMLPPRPRVEPTIEGLPPTPSKITLRKPSEPVVLVNPIDPDSESFVIGNKNLSVHNDNQSRGTYHTPAYSITSSMMPFPPTPGKHTTEVELSESHLQVTENDNVVPIKPRAASVQKRVSLSRSMSDDSLDALSRTNTKRWSKQSETTVAITKPMYEGLWRNRSSLILTDSLLLDAKTGISEHYNQHPLPAFATGAFSLLNPYRANTDNVSQTQDPPRLIDEKKAQNTEQLDGQGEARIFEIPDEPPTSSPRGLKLDRKVEKVRPKDFHSIHDSLHHIERDSPDGLDKTAKSDGLAETSIRRRLQTLGNSTVPSKAMSMSDLPLSYEATTSSRRRQRNASLSSLPLHKYLDLVFSLSEVEDKTEIHGLRRAHSLPPKNSSHTDEIPSKVEIQFAPNESKEDACDFDLDGHRSNDEKQTKQMETVPVYTKIVNRAFDFATLRSVFAGRACEG